MVVWVIWQGTIACWIFSPGNKKRFAWQHKCFVLLAIFLTAFSCCYAFSSCFSICFFLKVLLWRLCFSRNVIFSSRAFICFFWSRAFHPQFATSYFLFWMPCYCFKQRITVFGLQTYSNIFIEGILLKMLRNKSELDLEQAIWFFCVASTFALACVEINFLNIKEEDMFGKVLSLWHKIYQ